MSNAQTPETPPVIKPSPRWIIGLLLFLWLVWIGFLIWAGRNDWSRTRPVEGVPVPVEKSAP